MWKRKLFRHFFENSSRVKTKIDSSYLILAHIICSVKFRNRSYFQKNRSRISRRWKREKLTEIKSSVNLLWPDLVAICICNRQLHFFSARSLCFEKLTKREKFRGRALSPREMGKGKISRKLSKRKWRSKFW